MKNLICIAGPTASGKTALSIALAKEVGGEIVSCDSMQVYKRMDIGTAKLLCQSNGKSGFAGGRRPGDTDEILHRFSLAALKLLFQLLFA